MKKLLIATLIIVLGLTALGLSSCQSMQAAPGPHGQGDLEGGYGGRGGTGGPGGGVGGGR